MQFMTLVAEPEYWGMHCLLLSGTELPFIRGYGVLMRSQPHQNIAGLI